MSISASRETSCGRVATRISSPSREERSASRRRTLARRRRHGRSHPKGYPYDSTYRCISRGRTWSCDPNLHTIAERMHSTTTRPFDGHGDVGARDMRGAEKDCGRSIRLRVPRAIVAELAAEDTCGSRSRHRRPGGHPGRSHVIARPLALSVIESARTRRSAPLHRRAQQSDLPRSKGAHVVDDASPTARQVARLHPDRSLSSQGAYERRLRAQRWRRVAA